MKTRVWKLRGLVVLLLIAVAVAASAAGGGVALAAGSADVTPVSTTANDLLAGFTPPQPARATGVQRWEDAYRYDANGWTFLHIQGSPYHRGYGHGYLIAPELAQALRNVKYSIRWDTGQSWGYFVRAAQRLFAKKLSEEYLQEIKGIAAGATAAGTKVTWRQVLAWNANMELTGYWYPGILSGAYKAGLDNTHCSAFIATGSYTSNGKVVMAHNDWDHFVTGQFAHVIIDIQPAKGHRMIMQTFPGYIASMTDYFATDAGIMGTETTIGNYDSFDPEGLPEFYRMRKATQYADTLDGWVRIMQKGNNGAYANSWLLGDADSQEIMRFEQGLKYQSVERTGDGFYVGFNSATNLKIRMLECGGDTTYFDTRTACGARRVRLTQLMQQHRGAIDTGVAQTILADHYDVYLNVPDNPCSRTVDGHYELDPFQYWQARRPYSPQGAVDGKVMDSDMAKRLSLVARWGNSSGMPFVAADYFAAHPQWDYLAGYVEDRPTQPWTEFSVDALQSSAVVR
jgi:hypothetical protein